MIPTPVELFVGLGLVVGVVELVAVVGFWAVREFRERRGER